MMKKGLLECMLKWVCVMMFLVKWVSASSDIDALIALKKSLVDPDSVLESWDSSYYDACTFFHITCDNNHVIRIDLGNYNLGGSLVPDLANLEHLQYLELYNNNIQGSIPSELGNLRNLLSLDLYNNRISGTIPAELGKLSSLLFLRLNNNHLTGPIPGELTNLSSLKVLDFSTNDLSGKIPTTGAFAHIPLERFKNNPHLERPKLLGLAAYDTKF